MPICAPIIISLILLISGHLSAQYEKNPLIGKRWVNVSGGLHTGDHISWQAAATASLRSDILVSSARLAYSQELMEAPNDSVLSPKNRLLEAGLMWGEGYAGKKWYVSFAGGMGVNIRFFADDDDNSEEIRRLTAITIGVPVQVEMGAFLTESFGISLNGVGNWNFREPYFGAHIGFFYRLNTRKK